MKLTSRGARRTLAATCSTAMVLAGASFLAAAPASAAGVTLAFGPTATSATIANLDPTASAANAATAYGLKVTGATATDPDPLRLSVLTGPTGGAVKFERRAGNNAPSSARVGITKATTISADEALGQSVISVTSSTGFSVGDWVVLEGATAAATEYAQIGAIADATSITLKSQTAAAHVTGKAVYSLGDVTASTNLTADPEASATIAVTSTTGFVVGDWVMVAGDAAGGVAQSELRRVVTVSSATGLVLSSALTDTNHADADEAVVDLGAGTGMAAAAAGATGSLVVDSTAGLAAGDEVLITGATHETATISSVDDTTHLTFAEPLGYAHALGSAIIQLKSAAVGFAPVPVSSSRDVVNYSTSTNTDNIYLAATAPGTYTLQFFKDRNGNYSYDSAQDDASSTFTLNVKDVNGTTASDSSDDLSPSLSVESSVDIGRTITANVSTGLTTEDTRGLNGGSPSVGLLGVALAAASTITFDPDGPDDGADTGVNDAPGSTAFGGTYISRTSSASDTAGTASSTYAIGSAITRTSNTTVASNAVTDLDEDVTNVTGSVKDATGTGARAVYIKPGVAEVTYTGTVTATGDDSGKTVYFTLTTGTNSPALTADGTLVSSTATTKVYSAVTDADGVATLKVTSGTTTNGTTYTVSMASGNQTADLLTGTYQTVTATSFENTNTSASLLVTPGSSATLTGKLLDQFGAPFVPSGSDSAQVSVRIPAGGATAGNAALSSGLFSYTYTPSTTPTAGTSTSFDFFYDAAVDVDGTDSAINWASSESASSVTITAPVADATPTQKTATATHGAGTAVTGSVLNASNGGLAYKSVTLTGTAGVYFSNVATPTTVTTDDLATSVTVASNGSGVYTGYAFFTKAGAATITVTSGTATRTVDVSVTQASDPWKITAIDSSVEQGGTSVVSGTVKNGFDQPVSGATVNLSLGASAIAALGQTSVTTSADGVWSTTLTGASTGDGTATLTATLNGQTANATAHDDWLDNAGVTVPHGEYMDQATITVAKLQATTIDSYTVSGGKVTLTGKAVPAVVVEVHAKPTSGGTLGWIDSVMSDSSGNWTATENISAPTTYVAKTSTSTSSALAVPYTTPATTAKATIKFVTATAKGNGLVYIAVNGNGNQTTLVRYFRWDGKKWVQFKAMQAASNGARGYTIKASKGKKTFRIAYTNPGGGTAYKNVTVTVK